MTPGESATTWRRGREAGLQSAREMPLFGRAVKRGVEGAVSLCEPVWPSGKALGW